MEWALALSRGVGRIQGDPEALDLLNDLGLSKLLTPACLSATVLELHGAHQVEPAPHHVILLERLRAIFAVRDAFYSRLQKPKPDKATGLLTISLNYATDSPIRVSIVAQALSAWADLYNTLAGVLEKDGTRSTASSNEADGLRISYVESGSEIRIDLTGISVVLESATKLIGQLWEIYEKYRRLEYCDLNAELDMFVKISQCEKDGALSAEDANRVRVQLHRAGRTILCTGALPSKLAEEKRLILVSLNQAPLIEASSDTSLEAEQP